jgi:hypothetical protein
MRSLASHWPRRGDGRVRDRGRQRHPEFSVLPKHHAVDAALLVRDFKTHKTFIMTRSDIIRVLV